ncbi:hypothetical protein KIT04_054 [Vibrio phage KIT04]|nr:hypothetical protein KIT04_054 [Vibrio phage KIT04]
MKMVIPQDPIDSLISREDFLKRVEELVQAENVRIIGIALYNVTSINAKAGEHILKAITKLQPLAMDNPELVEQVIKELHEASTQLTQLAQHFEIEKAMGEKVHATQH